jgi:phenylpropionate dioxygenase-like ring-hydroxylating dioxygenase large terminal subunit
MLTSKQPVLRRFWYATWRLADLVGGPRPFRLMGEDLVLFLDAAGNPAALRDRCCHRTAKLSKGWCDNGQIVCGYHGWTYDRDGNLTRVPQEGAERAANTRGVEAFRCRASYGYAWVCLGEPLSDIPPVPEDGAPGFRRIQQFQDFWRTAPMRFMENSFDNSHIAFVHKGTFGQLDRPVPEHFSLTETDYGFEAQVVLEVANPPASRRITGESTPTTKRRLRNKWYLPFCRRLDIEYPSGVRHIIFNCATPVDDETIRIAQILYRNDDEASCSAAELIAWDQAVIEEDRDILESTDPDVPMDVGLGEESQMASDRPGLIMRRRLLRLLRDHGEREVRRPSNQNEMRAYA